VPLVLSSGKIQNFDVFLSLNHFYGTICAVKIKELLVLEFDNNRSKNTELVELGILLGSLLQKRVITFRRAHRKVYRLPTWP